MSIAINFTKRDENLYNNLIKEIRKYRKGNSEEVEGEKIIYLDEFQYVRNLNLNFTSITSIIIDDKPLIEYFTNLKAIHIKAPYRPTGDELESIPNKELIKEIEIEDTDLQSIDLTKFTNLEYLTIVDNKNLKEIKGLNKTNKLSALNFYNNPLLGANETYKFICANMKNNCTMSIDVLYYLNIRHLIRKEYSLYRDSFRATDWIETVNGSKEKTIINHNTRSTGMFYAKLNDILDQILPETDDLGTIYIIYKWLINKLTAPKPERVKITTATKSHLIGAFNAIYNNETTRSGYVNLFQMLLKACLIDSYSEFAYINEIDLLKEKDPVEQKPNHVIIKVMLDDNPYYCDTVNKLIYSDEGEMTQNCFMKTYEELDNRWYPVKTVITKDVPKLTKLERKEIAELEIANNKLKDHKNQIEKLMDKFDLHISEENKTLSVEVSIKKEQVEDLLLLGLINADTEKEIDNRIEKEYFDLLSEKNK